jgi:hypothetical protein
MAIEYRKKMAVFGELVTVDEAEALLEWLQKKTAARVDLAACTHVHPANLQVLMVARPSISAWPRDEALATWLRPILKN